MRSFYVGGFEQRGAGVEVGLQTFVINCFLRVLNVGQRVCQHFLRDEFLSIQFDQFVLAI